MGSSDSVNHSYDYRPNWTPLIPVTITNLDNFEHLQAIFKDILAVKVHRINFFCVAETLNFMSPIFYIRQKLSKSIHYNRLKLSPFLYDFQYSELLFL